MNALKMFLSVAAVVGLAGCSGGGDSSEKVIPDPLAAYKSQTVNWSSCDQYFFKIDPPDEYADYRLTLGDRVQCADIRAPLDYQNPDGLQISLSMLRVKAADAADSKPNLFFNPGGPGQDGLKYSLEYAKLLSDGSKDSVLGRKYQELSDAYNFVGFSPRGVGASTRIICAGNEFVYKTDSTKWGEDAQNIRNITDAARYHATNCQKNPVADYIHTDATARDMDLMRHLLGDAKLHYYGISYGTWLGFWYASIFPQTVGPMVLDSNMNFNKSIHDASIGTKNGQVHTFLNYIAPYAARHDDILGMGTSTESIVSDLNTIGHKTNEALHAVGGAFRAERETIPEYISSVKAAIETQKLIDQGRSLDEIGAILTTDDYIADEAISETFKQQAWRLVQTIKAMEDPGFYAEPPHFSQNKHDSVWGTVVCNDEPVLNKDQAHWINVGFDLARSSPIVDNRIASQPCIYWNYKTDAAKPSTDSLKNASLLMLQSEYDVPTPLSGAMETFDKLPNASMVLVHKEGAHGLMVYQTECVDLVVMDYMLGRSPQKRLTECQGKTLPLDMLDEQVRTDSVKSVGGAGARPAVSPFENPEMAEQLITSLRNATLR
jgi:pimeloyl-ACP methyl ester carboxylesterase